MIAGVKNSKENIKLLSDLSANYPNSNFANDVQFEIALTYIADENFSKAIPYLKKLVSANNTSGIKPKAYLKLGLAYYNNNDNLNAIDAFKTLIFVELKLEIDEVVIVALLTFRFEKVPLTGYGPIKILLELIELKDAFIMDALAIVALRAEKLLKATSPENGAIIKLLTFMEVIVQDGVVTEFVIAIEPPTLIAVPAFPILIVPAFTFPIPKVVPGTYTSTVGVVKLI
jgi:tetratricopeptide (TPR) repeat protein